MKKCPFDHQQVGIDYLKTENLVLQESLDSAIRLLQEATLTVSRLLEKRD